MDNKLLKDKEKTEKDSKNKLYTESSEHNISNNDFDEKINKSSNLEVSNVCKLSLRSLREKFIAKEISPLAVHAELLKRQKQYEHLNSYITVCEDKNSVLQNSWQRIVSGEARTLEGIPIGVKDLFCTNGIKTTSGSTILKNFVPYYESTVTQRLWNLGAYCFGKENMDEFAMGSSCRTSAFGPVKNPINEKCVPGGSSGGSAANVANYMSYVSIGSDTGGSVRQPAAFCGVVGVKPTYGRCSRYGIISYASSFDQAGVIARSVDDACIVLDEIMGFDNKDMTSLKDENQITLKNLSAVVKGKKIGFIKEHLDWQNEHVKKMWIDCMNELERQGATLIPISIPSEKYFLSIYYILTTSEAFSNLAKFDGVRFGERVMNDDFELMYKHSRAVLGDEVKRRILSGAFCLASERFDAYYMYALNLRKKAQSEMQEIFEHVDAILSPTSPNEAFELDYYEDDPTVMYRQDIFTVTANVCGLPGISVPAGFGENKLPLGMHVMTAAYDEKTMIEVAKSIEKWATDIMQNTKL